MILKCTFRKENFLRKENEKLKGREFLKLFVETLPNKLPSFTEKRQEITFLHLENYLIEVFVYLSFKS